MIRDTSQKPAEDQSAPHTILVYGETGAGKTFSLRTLPKSWLPALVLDFDHNSRALEGAFSPGELYIADMEDFTSTPRGELKPAAYESAKSVITDVLKGGLDFTPKTIVVDSVTRLYMSIMDHGLSKSSRKEGDPPQLQDYGTAAALTVHFTRAALQTGCNVVYLAHEKAYANEVTGIEKGVPALTGQLGDTIPRFFQEILHARATGGGNNRKYLWETQPAGKFVARTTYTSFEPTIPQDFSAYAA